jgi:pimeloyl-ACP methyl ester carboxylesterase
VDGRVVGAGGVELVTESVGDPAHPAVLLVTCAMASGVWWPDEFCRLLAGRGRFVIRYDHRDTGGSTIVASGPPTYGVVEMAEDAVAVLDCQVGAWRILAGSAHPFDEATVRRCAEADWERTPDPLTPFNHALLDGGEEWFGRLAKIVAPALVIHGTEDPVLSYAHGLALAYELPKVTFVALEGSGHELHRDDWPVILDAIERHTSGP